MNKKETATIKQLKSERQRLLLEIARIDKMLLQQGVSTVQYMNWKQKAMDFLSISGSYIQSVGVLEWVFNAQPAKLSNSVQRRKYITALSVALNSLSKEGIIKKFRVANIQGHFYGLPAWFTDDGALKKEFYGDKLNQFYADKSPRPIMPLLPRLRK